MNEIETIGAIAGAVAALGGFLLAWRKFRPETNDITVTTADKVTSMSLRFANEVSDDNAELRKMLDDLRADFDQYRRDTQDHLAELGVQLRAAKGEKQRVAEENTLLKARVADLETEVAHLKAARH